MARAKSVHHQPCQRALTQFSHQQPRHRIPAHTVLPAPACVERLAPLPAPLAGPPNGRDLSKVPVHIDQRQGWIRRRRNRRRFASA